MGRGRTYFIKCSMKVCKLTSSVKIVCAFCGTPPQAALWCVVLGLSLLNKKRAWDPPASHTMKRGSGNRSPIRSYQAMLVNHSNNTVDRRAPYPGILLRRFKQLLEVLVTLLVLVPNLAPLGNGLSVENQNMEERI